MKGLFLSRLIPVFASIALLANLVTGWKHKIWYCGLLSIAGPLMVLATMYLFWADDWSTYMLYADLMLIFLVSLWNLYRPTYKVCNLTVTE